MLAMGGVSNVFGTEMILYSIRAPSGRVYDQTESLQSDSAVHG